MVLVRGITKIRASASVAGILALPGCMMSGVVTSLAQTTTTEPARIEGEPWRPLFLGDAQIFVRYVDDEDLGVFSAAVLVDPGLHCVVGEVVRTGILNSEDGWTEPFCFVAEAGHTYRMRYRSRGYQLIDEASRSVVAEGGWTQQLELPASGAADRR